MIHDAQKYGARVALFGRKINNAEHQLAFIEMLRLITDRKITPEEAVRAYHAILQAKNIKPRLPLEKDLELTDQAMSYDGANVKKSVVPVRDNPLATSRVARDQTDKATPKPTRTGIAQTEGSEENRVAFACKWCSGFRENGYAGPAPRI